MTFKPTLSQRLTLVALALAGSAALAGTGVPAGELIDVPSPTFERHSARSRADVTREVIVARRDGTLVAAGEDLGASTAGRTSASARSRAEVKAEVMAARAAGTLLAAGEIERPTAAWPARVMPRLEMARSGQAGNMK